MTNAQLDCPECHGYGYINNGNDRCDCQKSISGSQNRISRDDMLMSMAVVASQRGTCSRLRVGAIVSRNGRIISTGYNGAPAGLAHCEHWDDEPQTGCTLAEHAERNAIAFAARYGVALEGAEMHTTHAPCLDCARSIINAGIRKVTFSIPYRLTYGVDLLISAGLQVIDIHGPRK